MRPLVLLKVRSGPIQNGTRTVRSGYDLIRLFNGLVRLQVMVHVNMNRSETVYKRADLANEPYIFLN